MLLLQQSEYHAAVHKLQLVDTIELENYIKALMSKMDQHKLEFSYRIKFKCLFIFHQQNFNRKLRFSSDILYPDNYDNKFLRLFEKKEFQQIDARLYYMAALFVTLKDQKRIKQIHNFSQAVLQALFIKHTQIDISKIKPNFIKILLALEKKILCDIGYNLDIFTGDYFLDRFFNEYTGTCPKELRQFCNIALESLMILTNKCLIYSPRILAKTAILRASKNTKKAIDKLDGIEWYNWKYHPDQEPLLEEDYKIMMELEKQLTIITFDRNRKKL